MIDTSSEVAGTAFRTRATNSTPESGSSLSATASRANSSASRRHAVGAGRGPVDYYLDPDEPPGRWWGQGRAALGLDDEVVPKAAQRFAHRPSSRDRGVGWAGGSARTECGGSTPTFSAPKSVSVRGRSTPTPSCVPRSPPPTPPS
ncbi:MAG: relaxase domain-containing protein [Acidimicrobiales bacterium]